MTIFGSDPGSTALVKAETMVAKRINARAFDSKGLPAEFEAKAIVVKVRKEIHFIGSWKPLDLSAHRNPSVLEFL
jgi:hypothetical protein